MNQSRESSLTHAGVPTERHLPRRVRLRHWARHIVAAQARLVRWQGTLAPAHQPSTCDSIRKARGWAVAKRTQLEGTVDGYLCVTALPSASTDTMVPRPRVNNRRTTGLACFVCRT